MKHGFLDRYSNLDSPLHGLEARTKILGFTALVSAVLLIPPGAGWNFFVFFLLTAILIGVSQIPPAYVLGRTLLILPFVLLAGLAAALGGEQATQRLLTLLMRAFLCLGFLVLMTNTTGFAELLRGLRRLGCPRVIVMNLGFLYRYLFVLLDEVLRMRQARDCRRVGRGPAAAELKVLGSMLGSLLLRSFERGERTYQAMLARGYAHDFPVMRPGRFTWRDPVFLVAVTAFICLAFGWKP